MLINKTEARDQVLSYDRMLTYKNDIAIFDVSLMSSPGNFFPLIAERI